MSLVVSKSGPNDAPEDGGKQLMTVCGVGLLVHGLAESQGVMKSQTTG
jgi:hypothetical protein